MTSISPAGIGSGTVPGRSHAIRRWMATLTVIVIAAGPPWLACADERGPGLAGALVGGFIAKELLSASLEGAHTETVVDDGRGNLRIKNLYGWPNTIDVDVCVTSDRAWRDPAENSAPDPAICLLDGQGRRLCLEKHKSYGGLKRFRIPWHCKDARACRYTALPAPAGEIRVLVADYDVKQASLLHPLGTGNLVYQPVDLCRGELGKPFVCEHGNARVIVSDPGSRPRTEANKDACHEEAVRVTRIWSEQFGSIGRRVNYLPDGAGMMGNTLKQLFVGPTREGVYRFGIALRSDGPDLPLTDLRFALRQDRAAQPLPLGDVALTSKPLPPEPGHDVAEHEFIMEIGDLGLSRYAWDARSHVVVYRDSDGDAKAGPEEELALTEESVVLAERVGNLVGGGVNFALTTPCAACNLVGTTRPGDACALCTYAMRFSDAWLEDRPVEGATRTFEVNMSPTVSVRCLNASCTRISGVGCVQPALCLYNNIGLIFGSEGTAPMRWNHFGPASDLALTIAASPSLNGVLRNLLAGELRQIDAANDLRAPGAERAIRIPLPASHDFGSSGNDYALLEHLLWGKVGLDGVLRATVRRGATQLVVSDCELVGRLKDIYQWSGQPAGSDLKMAQVSATYNRPGVAGRLFGVEVDLSRRVPELEGSWNGGAGRVEHAARPVLGWRFKDGNDAAVPDVAAVKPGGAADRAGVRAGDRIVAVGEHPVGKVRDVRDRGSACDTHGHLPLIVERDGKRIDLSIPCDRSSP